MKLGGPESAGMQAATDPWGNIRIPNIHDLTEYEPEDPFKWKNVPWTSGVQNYVSLVGDRIDGVESNFTGNTTFNFTSGLQNLNVSALCKRHA